MNYLELSEVCVLSLSLCVCVRARARAVCVCARARKLHPLKACRKGMSAESNLKNIWIQIKLGAA